MAMNGDEWRMLAVFPGSMSKESFSPLQLPPFFSLQYLLVSRHLKSIEDIALTLSDTYVPSPSHSPTQPVALSLASFLAPVS